MRITSSGNVGIGTTSPSANLVVNSNTETKVIIQTSNPSANSDVVLEMNGNYYYNSIIRNNSAGAIVFQNGTTERMRITSGGNVLIGTTTDSGYKLAVSGTAYVSSVLSIGSYFEGNCNFSSYTSDGLFNVNARPSTITTPSGIIRIRLGYLDYGGGQYYGRIGFSANTNWSLGHVGSAGNDFSIGTGVSGQILLITSAGATTFSGSVTATSFFESSDATIKTLITDNYQAKGIESVVAKLYVKNGKEELGYYAQDVQDILPSAVSKSDDGLLNLSYREVHTAKISSLEHIVKEQQAQIQELKELVNQLSSK
jgi:hypothetical protein